MSGADIAFLILGLAVVLGPLAGLVIHLHRWERDRFGPYAVPEQFRSFDVLPQDDPPVAGPWGTQSGS